MLVVLGEGGQGEDLRGPRLGGLDRYREGEVHCASGANASARFPRELPCRSENVRLPLCGEVQKKNVTTKKKKEDGDKRRRL